MDLRPQSEGFSFYRVPKQLVKGREYRPLSPAGKLLFALLLDRVSLSVKNASHVGEANDIRVQQSTRYGQVLQRNTYK